MSKQLQKITLTQWKESYHGSVLAHDKDYFRNRIMTAEIHIVYVQ